MQQNNNDSFSAGFVVAGLKGGSGKTVFSVGIIAALLDLGISVAPFKKGPDYIDAGWLTLAAGKDCYNLDTFLVSPDIVENSYLKRSTEVDFSVVEGNRGLYDCVNIREDTSTAALAKILKLPIILCVDASKMTRTMAAIISGVVGFDSNIKIAGVIFNRIAGTRHKNILIKNVERYCGIPVLGALPRLNREFFPERHMGLVPTIEHNWASTSLKFISNIVKKHVNIQEVLKVANYSGLKISFDFLSNKNVFTIDNYINNNNFISKKKPVIGIMMDSAFQFYYPENLKALKNAGAELVYINSFNCKVMSKINALYIGGGFPETYAEQIEKNEYIRKLIKVLAEDGMPIYAECGGLIYLGEKIIVGKNSFSMTGILPIIFKVWSRPQGHGYTVIEVTKKNPYYPIGYKLFGHEFHYSGVYKWKENENNLVFSVKRGTGFVKGKDGIVYKNVMGTYTHIHALGVKMWAMSLISRAKKYMRKKK